MLFRSLGEPEMLTRLLLTNVLYVIISRTSSIFKVFNLCYLNVFSETMVSNIRQRALYAQKRLIVSISLPRYNQ